MYDDYWSDDIRLDLIYSLLDDYPKILDAVKHKYLEILENQLYYAEDKIEQYKKEFEDAKKKLENYKNNL